MERKRGEAAVKALAIVFDLVQLKANNRMHYDENCIDSLHTPVAMDHWNGFDYMSNCSTWVTHWFSYHFWTDRVSSDPINAKTIFMCHIVSFTNMQITSHWNAWHVYRMQKRKSQTSNSSTLSMQHSTKHRTTPSHTAKRSYFNSLIWKRKSKWSCLFQKNRSDVFGSLTSVLVPALSVAFWCYTARRFDASMCATDTRSNVNVNAMPWIHSKYLSSISH